MDQENPMFQIKQFQKSPMTNASLVLGIISIASAFCFYLSLPCGAIGLILGILSRGSSMNYHTNAKIGMITSSIGIAVSIIIIVGMVLFVFNYYGGYNGLLKQMMEMYGASSMDDLYNKMGY